MLRLLDFGLNVRRLLVPLMFLTSLAFAPGAVAGLPAFAPYAGYLTGSSWTSSATIGDVTGDGRNDVLAAAGGDTYLNPNDEKLLVYTQQPDGTLAAPLRYDLPPSTEPSGIAVGDMNGDGRTDVLVSGWNGVLVFLQKADGTLGEPTLVAGTEEAGDLHVADMNGDGRPDLVLSSTQDGIRGIYVLLNTEGGFVRRTVVTGLVSLAAVADLNGDGRPDLVSAAGYAGAFDEWIQNASGAFHRIGYTLPSSSEVAGIQVADVTGDGVPDVIVGDRNQHHERFDVFPGSAQGLGVPSAYGASTAGGVAATADFDGDGRADVLLVHSGWSLLSLYMGQAGGTLSDPELLEMPYADQLSAPAVGDINGDGRPDIVLSVGDAVIVARQLPDPALPFPWHIDITSGPTGLTTSRTATFTFGSTLPNEPMSSYGCLLDDIGVDCSSPLTTLTLAPGLHFFDVRANPAPTGEWAPAEAARSWVVSGNSSPPQTTIVSGPIGVVGSTSATFAFSSSVGGVSFECNLDSTGFKPCSSTPTFTGLAAGSPPAWHQLEVRATNGTADPTPAFWWWQVSNGALPQPDPPLPSTGTVVHETSVSYGVYGSGDSRPFTVANVADRLLLFAFTGKSGTDAIANVAYGGQQLAFLTARSSGSVRVELWYLLDPPVGTATIAWKKSGSSQNSTWGVSLYSGVDQGNPFGALGQAGATGAGAGAKSLSIATAAAELVVDASVFNGGPTSAGPTATPPQDQHWSTYLSTTQGGAASQTASSGSTTVAWSPAGSGAYDWAIAAAAVNAAGATATPVNTSPPTISGTPQVGQTLTADPGSWTNPPARFDYRWRRCNSGNCADLQNDAATYTVASADVGFTIQVVVTAGPVSALSAPTGVVTAARGPSAPPALVSSKSFGVYGTGDSQSFTVPDVPNRLLVFVFAGKTGSDAVTSVTYGGRYFARLAEQDEGSVHVEVDYLIDPPAGTATLSWTKSGAAQNSTWGISLFSGVSQRSPFQTGFFGRVAQGGGVQTPGGPESLAVTATAGQLIFQAAVFNGATARGGPATTATQAWSRNQSTTQGGSATEVGGGPTPSWTPSGSGSYDWAIIGAPLNPP